MFRLLMIFLDTLSSAMILIPMLAIIVCVFFKQHRWHEKILIVLFGIYLLGVFSSVGLPNIHSLTVDLTFNWIPFLDILNNPAEYMKNTILNIILFLPLGVLMPMIWKEFRSLKATLFMGLGLSIAIELLQIFTYRLTDIDDLITNTLGAVLGYLITKLFYKKSNSSLSASEAGIPITYEPFIILAVTFFTMFLIQPLISNMMYTVFLPSFGL